MTREEILAERIARYTCNPRGREEDRCVEWLGATTQGYGYFTCRPLGGGVPFKAHRVVWELENGPIPAGLIVRHTCNNRKCVNIRHLAVGTQWDNADDAVRSGRVPRGETHHRAKLSDAQVDELVAKRMTGRWTNQELADAYGVTASYVIALAKGRVRRNDSGRSGNRRGTADRFVPTQPRSDIDPDKPHSRHRPKKPIGILAKRLAAMQ